MTWVVTNRIRVDAPSDADRIVEAFRHRLGAVDRQPGFRGLEVWREADGREVVVLTRWETRQEFEAWVASPAFQHAHARADGSPGSASATVYEVAV
ncbi:MAG TPA: antibiotic biosynthesis monooxygenase [Thermoplasmata archaeon]|nr:antibiotic biosynthesis monooxygenase [Thermoplasmata archaeon]HUJ78128.1 antibiotic biosynthesis monooxygenase [Thermoplasmata archaeon]